jgi:hypothetical protein
MVLYSCIKCFKVFNKKSNYILHTEHRKTPCNKITSLAPNSSLVCKMAPNSSLVCKMAPNSPQDIYLETKDVFGTTVFDHQSIIRSKCGHCNKTFVKQYGLNRHILRCNIIKNISEQLKMENENLKIENKKLRNEQKIKDDIVKKLKNEQKIKDDVVEKLKIENEKLNNTVSNKPVIINNNTINNNNININIVNYGEEDFSKLDIKKILNYDNSFI